MLDRREHLAAEQVAHDAHREEEVAARTHPARVIVREPAAGDDGVYVRMEAQLARPGVKHHRDAELTAETFWIAGEREEGLRRAREEHVEDRGARALRHGAQLGGQREDDVEVVDRQEPLEALVNPSRLRERLALGAVPIAARVVGRLLVPARRAHVEVAAEHGGPASLDVAQCGALLGAQHATLHERLAMRAHDVRELDCRDACAGAHKPRAPSVSRARGLRQGRARRGGW